MADGNPLMGMFKDGLRKLAGATVTPPASAKLRRYHAVLTLEVDAVNKATVAQALVEAEKRLGEWSPALVALIGAGTQMRIVGMSSEVNTGKKEKS